MIDKDFYDIIMHIVIGILGLCSWAWLLYYHLPLGLALLFIVWSNNINNQSKHHHH